MGTLTSNNSNASTKTLARPLVIARRYTELLGRTNFSFLQGASTPEEMVERSIELGYQGIGITDLHGLYGVVKGYQTAESPSLFTAAPIAKDNFKYLLGSELILTDGFTLTLMPMNKLGYRNLCEILTLGKRQVAKGYSKISLEDINSLCEGLLCFALPPWTQEVYLKLESIFSDRLYIPVWRDFTWESQKNYSTAIFLEKEFKAQLVVTQRPFMHSPERKPLFDVLTCIHHHTTLQEAQDKLIQNSERYLKTIEELSLLWQDRIDLVEKSVDISARINFSLSELQYRYPATSLPSGLTSSEFLHDLTMKGARNRYPEGVPENVINQLQHELSLIKELQYEDYFLTLKEICSFADSKKILYQGRGSAANSAVCFCLGLTAIDPIKMDLLFERFISRERREPPDIDIDFEHSRREEVIQHIYQKYDERHSAMVCTVIRFRSRMAIRETAKVFGIPLPMTNAIVKFMGRDGIKRLLEPEAWNRFSIPESTWILFLEMARQLHSFPRHLGIHTGGFLITQDPITEMVPVEKATMNGRYVIQWNKDDVDFLKLMKIDILSIGMLTCLRRCFDYLKEHKSLDLSMSTIPSDDKDTYDMICQAQTVGVFQIESRAQMNTLPRMQPRKFYDLVVQIALIRPGPLQGGMVHPYLKLRQEKSPQITYAHPKLESILKKTLGVPLFQEQVMKVVVAVANFTPGEADELRRVMSSAWKRKASMQGIRERLLQGFKQNGISEKYADQIYATIEGFSNYGFPESHSASYALISYASSWIKCHHPEVFACSLLNSQPMGFYEPRTIIAEAQNKKVTFKDLDIQFSDFEYTLEDGPGPYKDIRLGLVSIYGVPEELLKKISHHRKTHGRFKDLTDFIRRIELPRVMLIKLAASGALQSFQENTRELIWSIESINLDQQSFIWGNSEAQAELIENEDSENLPFESQWDQLTREYKTKGYSVHNHPLGILRHFLKKKNEDLIIKKYIPYFHSDDLHNLNNKSKVRVAGLLSITQRPPTAKGMCFLTLEDEFGFLNIVITPLVYQKYRTLIYTKSLFEIQGTLEKSGKITNILAEKILPLC